MTKVNPAAAAARENARTQSGQFGNQQHTAPAGSLDLSEPEPTMDEVAATSVAASIDYSDRRDAMSRVFPDGSVGVGVEAATYRTSTDSYMYEAHVTPDGTVRERINGQPYDPDGEHRQLRKARGSSRQVHEHGEELAGLIRASQAQQEAFTQEQDALFHHVVDGDGNRLEAHYTARGAEIGAKRHPGSSVEPARFDRDEYDRVAHLEYARLRREADPDWECAVHHGESHAGE